MNAKKSLRFGIAALLVLPVLGLLALQWSLRPSADPLHQGVPLSNWLADLDGESGEKRDQAGVALRAMGTNLFPVLLADLQAHDSTFGLAVREFAAKLPLANPPQLKAATRRERATLAFRTLGSNAAPATLPLIRILLHERASIYAAHALAGLGPEAVIPLRAALTNASRHIRTSAAFGLGTLNEGGTNAVPPLIEALEDRNAGVRATAADALGELGELPETAVPALMESLTDRARAVRQAAAKALAKFGAKARDAIPALSKTAADEDPAVANAAVEALKAITNAAAEARQ
ncbi:MAG: HEAT repeat domain-containing protein [Verrucomicrobia bacterium]|nr:HEAT repeat domain-containing protein [Verrucomicrobiota bacterium]